MGEYTLPLPPMGERVNFENKVVEMAAPAQAVAAVTACCLH